EFKVVNDTFGHAAGDEGLVSLARLLFRAVRVDEHVFRIGGDEFALIVNDTAKAAARVAERILRAARRQRRGRELPTLSARVAHALRGTESKEPLLRRADAALYRAKRGGRDRVVVADHRTVPHLAVVPQKAPAAEAVALPGPRPLRLLLVDDDPGLLILLRTT